MSGRSLPTTVGRWFLTDDDCAQYCLKKSDTEYEFVQLQWMDMLPASDSDYCVTHGEVDIGMMTMDDIESSIFGFYDSVHALIVSYSNNMTVSEYLQVIAECAFENEDGDNSICDVMSEEQALEFLMNYMRENP